MATHLQRSPHDRPPSPTAPAASAEPATAAEPPSFAELAIRRCSRSLSILAVLAIIGFLYWAREILIPITLAVLLSYALKPVVRWLRKVTKLHEAIAAALALVLILAGVGFGILSLQPQAIEIVELVPRAVQKLSVALHGGSAAQSGAVAKIERAASEIEKAANAAPPASSATASKAGLAPASATFRVRDYLVTGTMGLVGAAGTFTVVVVLVYLLLIAGDDFRRTLMRISNATLSRKKITVQMLDEIDSQIQRFLLVQLATSALLGVLASLAFSWVGLDNAMTWGAIGAVLHLVPYAGPSAFVALVAVVSFVQFDTLQPVAVIVASLAASTFIIGFLLVPWLTHKTGSLNVVAVFVALLAWGWLWGMWGLLLGVPIMMAVKTVCDHVEDMRPIGAFLGNGRSADDLASAGAPAPKKPDRATRVTRTRA